MTVLRDQDEVYLLCHTGGDDAVSWVERIDPITLEQLERSPDLPAGPTWPGGLAAHADGSLHVVFGRYAHRLSSDLELRASARLPRLRPYNSFVVLPDGHLVTKDYAGARPGHPEASTEGPPSELIVLEPEDLTIVASLELPERSIARLSADDDDIYVVGDTSIDRVVWRDGRLELDASFRVPYRILDGQTFGWDAVIAAGAAWFLDNGEGSDRYAGSFRGLGRHKTPLHLVRVDLRTREVQLAEICGLPDGLIANPPAIDPSRRIAVGYDSSNAIVTAFRFDDAGIQDVVWSRALGHAAHPVMFPDTGELVLCDFAPGSSSEDLVVVEVETGVEKGRCSTGSPIQSVLFAGPGWHRDIYVCSFTTISRIFVA
jgi:hypothetical protein